MTLYLYEEIDGGFVDGPFDAFDAVASSPRWEHAGCCLWAEAYVMGAGWFYENVKWCGDHWHVTSRGLRPAEPIRPHFLLPSSVHPS